MSLFGMQLESQKKVRENDIGIGILIPVITDVHMADEIRVISIANHYRLAFSLFHVASKV